MASVAAEMERRELNLPLLIGGATTSKATHRVANRSRLPERQRRVRQGRFTRRWRCRQLLSDENRDEFMAETRSEYEEIAVLRGARDGASRRTTIEKARGEQTQDRTGPRMSHRSPPSRESASSSTTT